MSDDRFDKLEGKVDKLDDRLDSVDKHLAVYNEQLKTHIARSDASETRIGRLEKNDLLIMAIIKVVVAIAGCAGFLLVVMQLMGKR